jgi:cell wall-associated NlpC family hydrolase
MTIVPSAPFDRRLTPARSDLAADFLRGHVDAPRYATGQSKRVIAASAPLRRLPDPAAPLETEALHGETVAVYDESEGWAWVQLDRDKYVGYLPGAALGAPAEPTHRVAALRAHAYPGPSIKLPPLMALSFGARLTIVGHDGDFAVSADGLNVWARHLAESGSYEPDTVAVAERFLETPYLWGGRTSEGIDCSGLVQTALAAAGVTSPRDSDMQEAALGEPVAIDDPRTPLERGDLVFWKGHVGIMRDPVTLLHANGWHMKVVSEPLQQARSRIAASGGGDVTSVRRLGAKTPLPTGVGQG